MTASTFTDDLVREYLLFRGFISSLKSFDNDLKNDKDKGFRVDRIVDQICSYISNYDLTSLRETWSHMEQRIFSRLENSFTATVRKLENSLLKMYIVTTIQNNRHDKLTEFFEKTAHDLQNQPEWKDWFVLPFLKCPEENPSYAGYFTRQWQDTMLVSLHNFFSVIFQCMPLPVLMSYEDEITKLNQLQEENDMLRQQVNVLESRQFVDKSNIYKHSENNETDINSDIMDDFYILAREAPSMETQQSKTIRSIIKNISSGLPTSPILGRRISAPPPPSAVTLSSSSSSSSGAKKQTETESAVSSKTNVKSKSKLTQSQMSTSVPSSSKSRAGFTSSMSDAEVKKQVKTDSVKPKGETQSQLDTQLKQDEIKRKTSGDEICMDDIRYQTGENKGPLLLLSQEDFREHQSAVTHCKFNPSGTLIASSDIDGIIKIWSPSPSPCTVSTIISKSSVLSLDWAHKQDRLLLHGNRTGIIRLYDTKEKKKLFELGTEANSVIKDKKIVHLASSPTESYFVSSCALTLRPVATNVDSLIPVNGSLFLWDMKLMKLLKLLKCTAESSVVNCSTFNHNGQLLIVGTTTGKINMFDMRSYECIAQWHAHDGETHTLQLNGDETSCYSLGSNGKFVQWSINKTGEKMSESILHQDTAGPFINTAKQQFHRPMGKLFSLDSEGKHVLSCALNSAIISTVPDRNVAPVNVLRLDGHKSPVITTDWATTMDCGTCITASIDGKITVSTLLAQ